MNILLIDAYDSFVYIIKNYIEVMLHHVDIVRCDRVNYHRLRNYDMVVLGPGPGHPRECGYLDVIEAIEGKIPLFGICLGMQAIAEYYGVAVRPAKNRQHGKISRISNDGTCCFSGLPREFNVTRYHSLVATREHFNSDSALRITAKSLSDNYVMAVKHKEYYIEGVQFHPESITTEYGAELMRNFFDNYV